MLYQADLFLVLDLTIRMCKASAKTKQRETVLESHSPEVTADTTVSREKRVANDLEGQRGRSIIESFKKTPVQTVFNKCVPQTSAPYASGFQAQTLSSENKLKFNTRVRRLDKENRTSNYSTPNGRPVVTSKRLSSFFGIEPKVLETLNQGTVSKTTPVGMIDTAIFPVKQSGEESTILKESTIRKLIEDFEKSTPRIDSTTKLKPSRRYPLRSARKQLYQSKSLIKTFKWKRTEQHAGTKTEASQTGSFSIKALTGTTQETQIPSQTTRSRNPSGQPYSTPKQRPKTTQRGTGKRALVEGSLKLRNKTMHILSRVKANK